MNKWTKFFFKLSLLYATQSKDPSTKVGAIICQGKRPVSWGFNGLPNRMYDDPKILENRDLRLSMTLHAELNAILFASKEELVDATIYITAPPCSTCCAAILQTGIKKVSYLKASSKFMKRWGNNIDFGLDKLRKADIAVMPHSKEEVE